MLEDVRTPLVEEVPPLLLRRPKHGYRGGQLHVRVVGCLEQLVPLRHVEALADDRDPFELAELRHRSADDTQSEGMRRWSVRNRCDLDRTSAGDDGFLRDALDVCPLSRSG